MSGAGTSTLTISSPATASATGVGLTVNQDYAPRGSDGLHIVVLNRTTLASFFNLTVNNSADLLASLTAIGYWPVGHFLPPPSTGCSIGRPVCMDDQKLVIIQSVGNGYVSSQGASPLLLQYLDELGGTPDLLLKAMAGQGSATNAALHRYALIGAATNLPWRGSALESSTDIPALPYPQTGQISGVLERGRDGLYVPLTGDPISVTNTALYQILYQPPTPWPYAQDTQELKYIADHIGLSAHEDVRSAYEDTSLKLSWSIEYSMLHDLTCTNPSDCGSNFEAVKNQLLTEFTWVPKVYQLGDNLLAPYQATAGIVPFDVQEITDEIKQSVPVPPSSNVTMKWLAISQQLLAIASGIAKIGGQTVASAVFGIASAAFALSTAVIQQPNSNGGRADAVSTTAANLEDAMAHQQLAFTQWVLQMEQILLYDYGKLQAVGTNVGNDPAWDWPIEATKEAINALQAGTRASAYSALLPVAWSGYNLKPDFKSEQTSDDVKTLDCGNSNGSSAYPFAGAGNLPQNQFHAITTLASDAGAVNQVWTFANLDLNQWSPAGKANTHTAQLPTSALTDNIYGPQATGSNGAFQFAPVWWRDTYNPPGHTACGTFGSTAWAPPSITPPP